MDDNERLAQERHTAANIVAARELTVEVIQRVPLKDDEINGQVDSFGVGAAKAYDTIMEAINKSDTHIEAPPNRIETAVALTRTIVGRVTLLQSGQALSARIDEMSRKVANLYLEVLHELEGASPPR